MDNLLHIITMPDNLPIVGMVVGLAVLMRVWWKQARAHDKLVAEGREDEIVREMRR